MLPLVGLRSWQERQKARISRVKHQINWVHQMRTRISALVLALAPKALAPVSRDKTSPSSGKLFGKLHWVPFRSYVSFSLSAPPLSLRFFLPSLLFALSSKEELTHRTHENSPYLLSRSRLTTDKVPSDVLHLRKLRGTTQN